MSDKWIKCILVLKFKAKGDVQVNLNCRGI